MSSEETNEPCPGCGALVPRSTDPGHAYIGATSGCWAAYTRLLEREYGEFHHPECHRLTVDSYAAQHPGTPSPRSIRSVAVHLIGLYGVLERGFSSQRTLALLRHAARRKDRFVWLDPPPSLGEFTVLDIPLTCDLVEHEELVRRWGTSVWQAWAPHRQTVIAWASG